MLEANGDETSKVEKYDEALAAYWTALSLSPSTPRTLLIKWVRLILVRGSVNDALGATAKAPPHNVPLMDADFLSLRFQIPRLLVYQAICDVLEQDSRLTEAIQCFQKMQNDFAEDTCTYTAWEVSEWVQGNIFRVFHLFSTDFRRRCTEKLENLDDTAMDSQKYDETVKHYSKSLTLNPSNVSNVVYKRSKARALRKSWEVALIGAEEVWFMSYHHGKGPQCYAQSMSLNLNQHPTKDMSGSMPRYTGAERYGESFEGLKKMLSKVQESPDPQVCGGSLHQSP